MVQPDSLGQMSRKYAQKQRFVCVFIIEPWNEDIFMGGFLTLGHQLVTVHQGPGIWSPTKISI